MNWTRLAEMTGWRVRLDPIPCLVTPDGEVAFPDHGWIVSRIEKGRYVDVIFPGFMGYLAQLGSDHIREFMSDPSRETDGLRHGIFILKVILKYERHDIHVMPLRR